MRLIRTHDGQYGWQNYDDTPKTRWFDSEFKAQMYGAASMNIDVEDIPEYNKEFRLAIEELSRTGNTIAEFGIFGSFMYTTTESEHEF